MEDGVVDAEEDCGTGVDDDGRARAQTVDSIVVVRREAAHAVVPG
jgi:hypothetical protein